ncbi:hypothetical protein N0V86_007871 [Didymella sp. IMI 355093]|nr:hypothetical protein N0V86_007871 [Didymella sp. IMI 355093]
MRSPQRSRARRSSSEDGSQYEMDLDALGLNSTFESLALEGSYEAPVDCVNTSEVEGPEDFTMNMTYWMTADLLPSQVKSRKEAQRRGSRPPTNGERTTAEEGEEGEGGDQAAVEASTAASPTVRVHGTTASRDYSTPASDRSMANEEKVRSFLSALPDTELDHLPTGTPLRAPHASMLQILRSSPPKARSLQPTVEDYDTPRKPTQQTVIHHPSPASLAEQKTSADRLAELQARLDQHELASRTRITELETILSYTRTELESSRNDNYKHKDSVARLEASLQEHAKQGAHSSSPDAQLKALQDGHQAQLQQLEQRLQHEHEGTLETQRGELERRLADLETSEREASENEARSQQAFAAERTDMLDKLSSLQNRADLLQVHLARATAEAQAAREDSQARESSDVALKTTSNRQLTRITHLETQLRDTSFSLECAQADVAAKEQLFQTNINLNVTLRALRSELEAQRTAAAHLESRQNRHSVSGEQLQSELAARDRLIEQHSTERDHLERQLSTAHGRIAGLENSLTTLRAQLTDAHRETGVARAEAERLAHDLEDAKDRLVDARVEADRRVADAEKKLAKTKDLKAESESKFRELKSQHDDLVEGHAAMLEDVRDKAEDAVRKTGALLAQERKEKARLKKDAERLQRELDDLRTEHTQEPPSPPTPTQIRPPPPPLRHNQPTTPKTRKSTTHASTLSSLTTSHEHSLTALRTEISSLRHNLETQALDHAAVNAAMDEQLSTLLSKLMKERARTLVGKRDGQWEEVQRSGAGERALLGKVLMRQWGGRSVVCPLPLLRRGEGQVYAYRYVKKER